MYIEHVYQRTQTQRMWLSIDIPCNLEVVNVQGSCFWKTYKNIKVWKLMGDSTVIVGNFNGDIRSGELEDWKTRVDICDAIISSLDDDALILPTYDRGIHPIDTLLCTAGVVIGKAGYLPSVDGDGDHRPIFVGVSTAPTIGVKLIENKKVKVRQLKLEDPMIILKYNKLLKYFFIVMLCLIKLSYCRKELLILLVQQMQLNLKD